jgi:hypothetical protein
MLYACIPELMHIPDFRLYVESYVCDVARVCQVTDMTGISIRTNGRRCGESARRANQVKSKRSQS